MKRQPRVGCLYDHIEVGEMEEMADAGKPGGGGAGVSGVGGAGRISRTNSVTGSAAGRRGVPPAAVGGPPRRRSGVFPAAANDGQQASGSDPGTPVATGQSVDVADFESCVSYTSIAASQSVHLLPKQQPPLPPATAAAAAEVEVEVPADETAEADDDRMRCAPPQPPPQSPPPSPPREHAQEHVRAIPRPPHPTASPPRLCHFTSPKCASKLLSGWTFLNAENWTHLAGGGSLYNFVCAPGTRLTSEVSAMMQSFINLTYFPEHEERGRRMDLQDVAEQEGHVFIFNKAMYALPVPIEAHDMTTQLLSSPQYQKACQPQNPKIFTDVKEADTFRFRKYITFFYHITVQLHVSDIPKEHWPTLQRELTEGLEIHHALLLQRTKRNETIEDPTRFVRSLLLFHIPRGGGVLVTNVTAVANTKIPSIISAIVNNFGASGAAEVAETAELTRKHLVSLAKKKLEKR